ncbi:MAG: hypothetical protein OXN16_08270 [Gammaproteobacteria bacterium]|nr:hypothetical protein [Gammaproteobacteria bacterium]
MNLDALDPEKLAAVFVLWVVVAVIIEEAAGVLFNWKPYRDKFSGKGLKTPIVFVLSVLICTYFNTDILIALIGSVGITGESNWVSTGVSALLLTGGSSTAFKTLNKMREARKKVTT